MKTKKDLLKSLFLCCITIGIVFLVIVKITHHKQNESTSSVPTKFDGWYTMLNDRQDFIKKEKKINSQNGECIVYNVLPEKINNSALLFRTYHQCVEVLVKGQVIYEYGTNVNWSFGKSPGSAYHIVDLDSSYAGEIIEIKCKSEYASTTGKIFDFYVGAPETLIIFVVLKNLSALIINIILFILGIAFLLIASMFSKNLKTKQAFYIGVFVLLFSIWSILQTCVLQLIINNNILLMFIEYIAFLLLPISAFMYVRELFRMYDDKGIKLIVSCFSINFIISIILQLMNIKDIKEMMPVYHTFVVVSMVYIYVILHTKYRKINNRISRKLVRVVCSVVLCMVFIDTFRYYRRLIGDGSKYTRIGVLILITYMLFSYMQEYINKSKEYTEARLMAKLAYKDVMTGLYNRTAYAEDTAVYEKQLYLEPEKLNLIYVILDLNNLKIMNDFHGHCVGDHYIVTTGKIIKKAFENIGKCYRIGGDEFAVIMKDKNLKDYQNAIKELKNLINEENETADLEYSLAYGYAVFEAGKYSTLKELIDKADKNMYENKNIYKGNRMSIADAAT